MCDLNLLSRTAAVLVALLTWIMSAPGYAEQPAGSPGLPRERIWAQLIAEADGLALPTRFLTRIPPGFLTIEFEDLRSFAAEYHPEEHRMVLNRSLSLNAAGGTFRPLSQLTHQEVATLYHEFFHAYLDFIMPTSGSERADPVSERLLAFARTQQSCRYERVLITPVVQRKSFTEVRFLSERESWEALNETWAVFVGWFIWTTLEMGDSFRSPKRLGHHPPQEWFERLAQAHQEGILRGYYEPENPRERELTNKRHLAPSSGISALEVSTLLEAVLEEPPEWAQRAAAIMLQRGAGHEARDSCGHGATD